MHLWNLGLKPVQHDEGMFAYFSWLIYEKMPHGAATLNPWNWIVASRGYDYDPLMHGPILEWAVAVVFRIFGDNDYTMRLLDSVCGLGAMWVIYRMRETLGTRVAWLAIIGLGISPSFTYVSRFIRPDMLMIMLYIYLACVGWRYSKSRSRWTLAWLTFLCVIASFLHETYVIYFFFVLTFALGCVIHTFVRKKDRRKIPIVSEIIYAFKRDWWVILIAGAVGEFLSVIMHTSFFHKEYMKHWFGQLEAVQYWQSQNKEHRIVGPFHFYWMHLLIYEPPFIIFWVVCLIKEMWPTAPSPTRAKRRILFWIWLIGSYLILLVPAHYLPIKQAWVMPDSWPLNSPEHSYISLWNLPLAGPTPAQNGNFNKIHMELGLHLWMFVQMLFVVCVVGWKHLDEGRVFFSFTDYWTMGSLMAFGYAGEKVPWVTAHVVLPLMISCGFYADQLLRKRFDGFSWKALFKPVPRSPSAPNDSVRMRPMRGKPAGRPAPSVPNAPSRPRLGFARAAILLLTVISLGWTLRIQIESCLFQPGSPLERHSFSSSHPFFFASINYIEHVCREQYQGLETPIAHGGQPGWPLNWSLRNYKNIRILNSNWDARKLADQDNEARIMVNMRDPPGTSKEAEFVIFETDVFNETKPPPKFASRYDWARVRYRHFFTPVALDWQSMKKIWLLLRSDESLSDDLKIKKQTCKGEWMKFLVLYFLRNEELSKDNGPYQWNWLGGMDVHMGRLKPPDQLPPIPGVLANR